eukprot:2179039-Pleurochrysis_carterae.AAC.1
MLVSSWYVLRCIQALRVLFAQAPAPRPIFPPGTARASLAADAHAARSRPRAAARPPSVEQARLQSENRNQASSKSRSTERQPAGMTDGSATDIENECGSAASNETPAPRVSCETVSAETISTDEKPPSPTRSTCSTFWDPPCRICRVVDDEPNVLCELCVGAFHLECIKGQSLPRQPDDDEWFCRACVRRGVPEAILDRVGRCGRHANPANRCSPLRSRHTLMHIGARAHARARARAHARARTHMHAHTQTHAVEQAQVLQPHASTRTMRAC